MSLAIMGSPGPATISILAASSVYGPRRSIPYMIGIIVGTAVVLAAVATGITVVLLALPAVGPVVTGLSAAYILWLAYRIATAPALRDQTAAAAAPSLAGGTFLGVANPKAWVACAAVFSSTRLAEAALPDATAKLIALALMIVVIMVSWLGAGALLAPLFRHPRRARVMNIGLAVALVATTALAVFI